MPISVPGHGKRVRQRGFSLLEVLIVLAIIGIATTAVGVSGLSDNGARTLRQDALRLTQLFTVAQAQARKGGSPIIWQYDSEGYRFAQATRDLFLPSGLARPAMPGLAQGFPQASPLRPRAWTSGHAVQVQVDPPDSNVFNTEWISGPLLVELNSGRHMVSIVRLGNGQYQVQP